MTTKALREQRAKLVADFRAIYDRAETEKRSLNADELAQAKALNGDISSFKEQIDLAETRAFLDNEERAIVPETQRAPTSGRVDVEDEVRTFGEAITGYIRRGALQMNPEHAALLAAYNSRSQNTYVGAQGGYLVRPDTSLFTSIVEAMKFFGGVRNIGATVLSTSTGADLPIPTDDDTANEGAIVNEEGSHDGGTDLSIGQRVLKAYLYSSKIVKVSMQLLQDADFDIEAYLGRKFGMRIARIHNRHATNGDGANKPQGYIPHATVGKTAASATAITADEILDLIHSVDRAYRTGARFSMNDSTVLALRKLKDADNQYIWRPGMSEGEPDRLFGYPVTTNNDIPAIATAARTIAFGDHSAVYLRDVRAVQVVRLNELYAANGQVGFLAFSRHDAALIDAGQGPIKVLKQA